MVRLSSQQSDPTNPPPSIEPDPPPTEPISPSVVDKLLPPELDFEGSDIISPSSKSKKPELIDPQIILKVQIVCKIPMNI